MLHKYPPPKLWVSWWHRLGGTDQTSLLLGLVPTIPAGGGQTHPFPPTLQAHDPVPQSPRQELWWETGSKGPSSEQHSLPRLSVELSSARQGHQDPGGQIKRVSCWERWQLRLQEGDKTSPCSKATWLNDWQLLLQKKSTSKFPVACSQHTPHQDSSLVGRCHRLLEVWVSALHRLVLQE